MSVIDDLVAKQAIKEVVLRYARCIDRRDFATLATLYADDSIDDHGGFFCGSGADFVEWLPATFNNLYAGSHQIMNHLIVLDPNNSDYAEGEVYVQGYHLSDDGEGGRVHLIGGARYLDKYTKASGVWQFAHRKIAMDYEVVLPAPVAANSALLVAVASDEQHDDQAVQNDADSRGGIGESDPSHGFFRFLR